MQELGELMDIRVRHGFALQQQVIMKSLWVGGGRMVQLQTIKTTFKQSKIQIPQSSFYRMLFQRPAMPVFQWAEPKWYT
jgi:hypothetical protein